MVLLSSALNHVKDPPIALPEDKYSAEEKKNHEIMRRWKVHIFQMEIANTSG